ncbi:hypothetical protein IVB11_29890 [Bradyrhizobium sp. 177]|uniref:hypothetical protein n=1 Tax=Bradyrhizobium sp. 177 TaxID=2782647 RepID=UPI001FF80B26|nr:hypothetical protein [Bradyrhizobium sp. 177]MCK1553138.1 hypothetical protein [Bradyrhizobium sp. 177]
MGGYVEGPYTLRAGEKIAVRTNYNFHVRTVGSATAIVLIDVNRPGSAVNVPANTSMWLTKQSGTPDPTVEAVGGYVVIGEPLIVSGVPEPVHYW